MSQRHVRCLVTVPAAVLAAVLGVTAALAAATWAVKPGGSLLLKSGSFIVKDPRTGASFTCAASAMGGTIKRGSGLPGGDIGSVQLVSFSTCTNAFDTGTRYVLTPRDLPWHLNAASYDSTTRVVAGTINHIHVTVLGPACDVAIDGTSATAGNGLVRFTYSNTTGALNILRSGGTLHFWGTCSPFSSNGDPATWSATDTVSPKETITSP